MTDVDGRALRQGERAPSPMAAEHLPGSAPGWLQADWVHALTSTLLAAFMIAAAQLRAQLVDVPLDPLASLLRVVAAAFVVRALLAIAVALRAAHENLRAKTQSLSLQGSTLTYCDGSRMLRAEREEILGIVVPDLPRGRSLAPRLPPLYLVLKPARGAPRFWAVPPYFTATSDILAARLERWRASSDDANAAPQPAPSPACPDPDARFEEAKVGMRQEGDVSIQRGHGLVRRAPYTGLLGLLFGLDLVRTAPEAASRLLLPLAMATALYIAFLLGWLYWMNRSTGPASSLAMLLSDSELLVGTRRGAASVAWDELESAAVSVRLAWSPFWGSYPVRLLELATYDGRTVRVDEGFLSVPPEVVAQLCLAKRVVTPGVTA